jgi:hypothetical protein
MSYAKLLPFAAAAVLSTVALPTPSIAAAPEALFSNATEGRGALRARVREAVAGKQRRVRVARGALKHNQLLLNLGVGPDLIAVRERIAEHRDGRKAWIGQLAGERDSQVVLAEVGDAVAGTIRRGRKLYKLLPSADGGATLAEVDASDPLPSGHMPDPLAGLQLIPDALTQGGGVTSNTATTSTTGTANIIDLLVAYSPEAKLANGGQNGIEALITLAVAETNQAYLNSQAPVQLRLVGTLETSDSESGNMSTDLGRLASTTDGYLDDVLTERAALGADVVSLIVNSGNYCGVGYQLGMLHPAYADYAFNVVKDNCATGYYSFGHEIGHNLGLSHDHDNASSGLYAYSYGHQAPDASFRTIMAYTCVGGCVRVQHFSNPDIDYAGQPTGVLNYADNALALVDTAPMVATWRAAQVPLLPISPNDLNASAQGSAQIALSWSDVTDEDGYQLERSADGGQSFSLIATLAADSVSYSDTGLSAASSYIYRLSAFNSAGVAAPSNDAWATTDPIVIPVPNAPSALSASAVSATEIALSWSDNASDESGFELERDAGAGWTLIATLAADTVSYSDQGLAAASPYSYRVRALGAGDPSAYSAVASASTQPAPLFPPAAPNALSANAVSASEISLSWSDQAHDEDGFEIERSTDGGQSWSALASLASDTESYSDTGLAAQSFYHYRVRAYNADGDSAWSASAAAQTQAAANPCTVSGAANLRLYSNTAYWTLSNTGSADLSISRIELTWHSRQGNLKRIYLDGATIWSGSIAPNSADLSSGWDSNTSRRVLSAGASEDLKLRFSSRYTGDSQSDYSITVHFGTGCSVSF